MVLHTGDLVDNPRLRPVEWANALSVMKEFDACRMRYAIAFGNHDLDDYPPPQGQQAQGDRKWKELMSKLAYRPEQKAPSGRSGLVSHALRRASRDPRRGLRRWLGRVRDAW